MATALSQLAAGDTLYLLDGTYCTAAIKGKATHLGFIDDDMLPLSPDTWGRLYLRNNNATPSLDETRTEGEL